jgi:hypothetical protein
MWLMGSGHDRAEAWQVLITIMTMIMITTITITRMATTITRCRRR